ncbi:FAD-dependent monooxygenase [Allofrancisella guangzhouensis]|uniref:2-octaprenyl-6-methoxyphenyl hydroxylase n=1 Tax=Allofrancisella guangzhouensis TaxID=594679 RepID=A0A0A8E587_9GAMM|nr:FAD-dependent monooxygenase [Allofrancisella guangzhouensis]AJC49153.1 2-octaprenyl-6-methoxyphenyl hydroxylase [Allofrancisella guangzhouensis]MBK2026875.1 FAD-dependent monooxygenase [Allofrancisella guangzhouensis]MBK2044017.1 FAD-dependent monooxygenase [Allofrancisella guangzhouensis]MBK2045335.1 FAD-dependent monooxygenase [Allofrancisella guangzhouensis]
MTSKYDIAIVGGGVVGLLTSLALAKAKLNIIHIEKDELEVKNDNRSLALSYSSIAFLNTLEIWDKITSSTQPIQKVHISDKGKYGRAEIFAKDENLPFLGTIAPMQELLRVALEAVANNPNITKSFATNVEGLEKQDQNYSLAVKHKNGSHHEEVIQAKLIIACDGANSSIRKMLDVATKTTDYNQDAVVFDIQTELEHKNTAFERFMSDGVLAILPKTNNTMGCVWTVGRDKSKSKLDLDNKEFENFIQERFGYRLGQLKLISKPAIFPLYLIQSEEVYKQNILFFGNALHFLHPVSGQGLNLSIRDIGYLYDLFSNDFSVQTLSQKLAEFTKVRKPDHDRTIYITHGFIRWFVSNDPKLAVSRNIGLHLLQRSKLAKKALSRVMMGKLSNGSTLMRKVIE